MSYYHLRSGTPTASPAPSAVVLFPVGISLAYIALFQALCALFGHHSLEKLAQLNHVSTRCKADSDFIQLHSPLEPV